MIVYTSKVRFRKTVASVLVAFFLFLAHLQSDEASCHVLTCPVEKLVGQITECDFCVTASKVLRLSPKHCGEQNV